MVRIVILGSGVTGTVTALTLSKRLTAVDEILLLDQRPIQSGGDYDHAFDFVTKDGLDAASTPTYNIHYLVAKAPTAILPTGIEVQSGQLWNGRDSATKAASGRDNPRETFYIHGDLSEYSRSWLADFVNWDGSDERYFARAKKLYAFNLFARARFGEFFRTYGREIDFTCDGHARLFMNSESASQTRTLASMLGSDGFPYDNVRGVDVQEYLSLHLRCDGVHIEEQEGIFYPKDCFVNTFRFRRLLTRMLSGQAAPRAASIKIARTAPLIGGRYEGERITEVTCADGSRYGGDVFVIAMSGGTQAFLQSFGVALPTHPLWGWKAIIPMRDDSGCNPNPRGKMTVGFEDGSFIITIHDGCVIAGGTTEFVDFQTTPESDVHARVMIDKVRRVFGDVLDYTHMRVGCAARTMLLDDLPVVGNVPALRNILIALPTGHLGFLHCAAMGEITASLALGDATPEIMRIAAEYSLARFS